MTSTSIRRSPRPDGARPVPPRRRSPRTTGRSASSLPNHTASGADGDVDRDPFHRDPRQPDREREPRRRDGEQHRRGTHRASFAASTRRRWGSASSVGTIDPFRNSSVNERSPRIITNTHVRLKAMCVTGCRPRAAASVVWSDSHSTATTPSATSAEGADRAGPTPNAWCEACGSPTRSGSSSDPLPLRHLEERVLEAHRAVGGEVRHRRLPDQPALSITIASSAICSISPS